MKVSGSPSILPLAISTRASCGGTNGSAGVYESDLAQIGTAPFTYNWNPSGHTDSLATGLAAGIHEVHVLDSVGCQYWGEIEVEDSCGAVSGIVFDDLKILATYR